MSRYNTIGIIGAGAWGTALASAAERPGRRVALWSRDADPEILRAADALLMVVPAQALRAVTAQLAPHFKQGAPLISCAKGIERGTLAFPTAMLQDSAPEHPVAVLSGPSFAADVSRGLPTAVTLACADEALAAELAAALASPAFRLYHTTDIMGVELGGAAKNVLAIAAGIAAGRGLGASAGAALIARGFAELRRLGTALGAEAETLMGLSGLGDLVLTATSPQSRNFALGEALGRGAPLPDKLAEGAFTAEALVQLAARHNVEMPVSSAVRDVLSGACGVDQAVENLLSRPLKAEAHHPQKCEAVLR